VPARPRSDVRLKLVAERQLTRTEARRIAVRAQLLEKDRPGDLLGVVDRLTFLQLDPTAAIAPSADLVAWSRLGGTYEPAHLQDALERDRALFEHHAQPTETEPVIAMVRPMADLGLFLADMAALRSSGDARARWIDANRRFRQRLLDQLRDSGPLSSRDIPDASEVPWKSSGWTNERNVTRMLEFLAARGEIAIAARQGRVRLWDLAERIYPASMAVVPRNEAHRIRDARRLRALGIARPALVGEAGTTVEVEATVGPWRVDPEASAEKFDGRTALLSPFDRLVHDRARARDLFEFDYLLEMYKPKDKRRWGYFALPVLHEDQLVGKVDAIVDRAASVLHVNAIHPDLRFTRAMTGAVRRELDALASWLGLAGVTTP
jgi:uncharacterized protein YcaQ